MSETVLFIFALLFGSALVIAATLDFVQWHEAKHWRHVSMTMMRRLHARGAVVMIDDDRVEIIWPDERSAHPIDSAPIVE
jgi:uncharacterized membrane protein YsdA (DUF1294 family)